MGNKNNFNNANFMQAGCQHNNCGCENNSDVMAAAPYNTGCGCENETAYTGPCGCENAIAHNGGGKWNKNRGRDNGCEYENGTADETHVFFETCDGAKEVCVTGRCQEDEALGRTLDVSCTLLNVCPGRRSALGLTLTEMDEDGTEYARGFRAITVPAHNNRCNQDVQVDPVRFILPEDLSLQNRRHFIVRTQHHYLDAGNIWNNSWGGKH